MEVDKMNRKARLVIVVVALAAVLAPAAGPRAEVEIALFWDKSGSTDEETTRFLDAKEPVLAANWEEAEKKLRRYLDEYPDGRYEDEALYWLARSQNNLARAEEELEKTTKRLNEAIQNLDGILKRHRESLWYDDARALRLEISGGLAALGDEEHKRYLEAAGKLAGEQKKIKLIALEMLASLEPALAISAITDLLEEEEDPAIRKDAIVIIGEDFPEESMDILREVEESDPDSEVRKTAALLLDYNEKRLVPVHFNYYLFRARMKDADDWSLIPEGGPSGFELEHDDTDSPKEVERAVKRLAGGSLSDVKISAMMWGGLDVEAVFLDPSDYEAVTAHEEAGYRIQMDLVGESFVKTANYISGEVHFRDLGTGKDYTVPYRVDGRKNHAFAVRKGDRVAVVVIQFESDSEEVDIPGEPKYNLYVEDILGAVLHSTRKAFTVAELSMQDDIVDYGMAKVEIPDTRGKWILVGNILVSKETREFIGRNATLYDPAGQAVAQSAEITVPADSPGDYRSR
jgi:tetratricopeptide (TPR) repeat protein